VIEQADIALLRMGNVLSPWWFFITSLLLGAGPVGRVTARGLENHWKING
jgi:hypothetical protein